VLIREANGGIDMTIEGKIWIAIILAVIVFWFTVFSVCDWYIFGKVWWLK
jgi:hypothetical protein